MTAEQKAMMEAWTKYATPGEPHQKMARWAGSWNTVVKEWMAPGAPPTTTQGSAEFKMILGGRYQQQNFEGTMFGQPFSGVGITGFDNAKKIFQTAWFDNGGTGLLMMTGTWDEATKALTETGTMDDVVTGKPMQLKGVTTSTDDDHMTYEMWMTGPDGKMFKTMEIAYTRKK